MKKKIKFKDLITFSYNVLKKVNLNEFSAKSVSEGLCITSLRGVDSHGIRLLEHYVKSALFGRKNPNPKFKFYKNFSSIGVLDADNGFGHAAGKKALQYGVKIANKNGIGLISVINSSHCGSLASIALTAAYEGYICMAFTHADSLILPTSAIKPYLGTNPLCFVAPRKGEEPYCLDMSSSKISWNKLLNYKNNKKKLPNDVAANILGNVTNNPNNAKSLLPFGDYKGYGMASMIEILCGIYSGMNYANQIPAMFTTSLKKTRKLSQMYILIRTDGVISKKNFLDRMKNFSKMTRNQKAKKNKKVLMPNDPEIQTSIKRFQNGIPIDIATYRSLKKLESDFHVKLQIY